VAEAARLGKTRCIFLGQHAPYGLVADLKALRTHSIADFEQRRPAWRMVRVCGMAACVASVSINMRALP
jgi:hypothetical protein